MSAKILTAVAILILSLIIIGKGLAIRKEITYQEVIQINNGIAVINGTRYLSDKLQVVLFEGKRILKKCTYDKRGVCLFEGLDNQKRYAVEIKRTDLKGMLIYKKSRINVILSGSGSEYFVLVGASIGKSWKFDKLPGRLNLGDNIVFGNRTRYDFDKSEEILALTEIPVPVSGVIIKECAAFFPRELEPGMKLIKSWVNLLRSKNITPILATVVPVTKDHDKQNPGRYDSILKYNDFIRSYALSEGIYVLDLEKALRTGDEDRHLRENYAGADGLHLVGKAYDALDMIILQLIQEKK